MVRLVIWDAITPLWRHCNNILESDGIVIRRFDCAHNHKIIVVGNVLVDIISQWILKQSCCSNMQSTHLLLGKHHIEALNSTDSPGQCDTDNTLVQYDTTEATTILSNGD